jgi:hypothetical protein
MIKQAADPDNQYYTWLNNYEHGKRDYSVMKKLSMMARSLGDQPLASDVAEDYIDHYLVSVDTGKLYTKENLEFIASSTRSSKMKSFPLFYPDGEKVDSVMGEKGFAQNVVDAVIYNELIFPAMAANKEGHDPDWNKIKRKIRNEYSPEYADRNIVWVQMRWYNHKNWAKFIKYSIEKVDKYGVGAGVAGDYTLNLIAWKIFQYSNSNKQINTAIKWMEGVVERIGKDQPPVFDTYANLLYKIGRVNEAIDMEGKASMMAPGNKEFQKTLAKMKKREPTWVAAK